ncbi:hypothetical protein FDP41_007338 [Naegleria fowleri]|uniref:Uncharacterized protein n=1 Tax=Naegleria fowleri TaxID=5763 RepID=A0A6A5BNJ9_NAEFO|nr:uncharacterized protein FDP41_001241 [Naegleria fowleri]XP_044568874.1 uncharacterized protein FDP41_007338 [Naegleria fowleri]KAF0979573.1 hypothetical protein FDP41_001241 [Naegleria fowleri]KAF0984161.1 hypothetical protein FDP41_007338 [Naegleria fowleri]
MIASLHYHHPEVLSIPYIPSSTRREENELLLLKENLPFVSILLSFHKWLLSKVRREFFVFYLHCKNDFNITIYPSVAFALSCRVSALISMYLSPERGSFEGFASLSHSLLFLAMNFLSLIGFLIFAVFFVYPFTMSNQMDGVEEDRLNEKTYRPLVSGETSLEETKIRWAFACTIYLAMSASHHLFWYGLVWTLAYVLHNHCGFAKNWFFKNLSNTIGVVCMIIPYWHILNGFHDNDHTVKMMVYIIALTFLMTIDAQDFRDLEGDAMSGRVTLPILLGSYSRVVFLAKSIAAGVFYFVAMLKLCQWYSVRFEYEWIFRVYCLITPLQFIGMSIGFMMNGNLTSDSEKKRYYDDRIYKLLFTSWYGIQLLGLPIMHALVFQ